MRPFLLLTAALATAGGALSWFDDDLFAEKLTARHHRQFARERARKKSRAQRSKHMRRIIQRRLSRFTHIKRRKP